MSTSQFEALQFKEVEKPTPMDDQVGETAEAFRYLEEGPARGEVVITVVNHNKTKQRAATDLAPLRFAKRVSANVKSQPQAGLQVRDYEWDHI